MGCEGGESSTAYEYAKDVGIVSGSKFGDTETCAPYPFEACHHPCSVFPTPTCPKTCVNKDAGPFANMEDKVMVEKITACPSFDYACVARELFNNGPVSSYAGDIYEEFYAYSDGVFRESKDENSRGVNHGGHVIKVIGWGKEPNESEKKGVLLDHRQLVAELGPGRRRKSSYGRSGHRRGRGGCSDADANSHARGQAARGALEAVAFVFDGPECGRITYVVLYL